MSCGKPQVTVISVFRLTRILAFDHKDHNVLWMLTFIYSNKVHFPLLLSLFRNLTFPPQKFRSFFIKATFSLTSFPLPSVIVRTGNYPYHRYRAISFGTLECHLNRSVRECYQLFKNHSFACVQQKKEKRRLHFETK